MAEEQAQTQTKQRGAKRTLTGVVTRNKMDKTIVVAVSRRVVHKRYQKFLVRKSKFKAHDANNECNIGDTVEIVEHRPLSKGKRWKLKRVIHKAVA